MDLKSMRKNIDRIDAEILRLLNTRHEYAISTKRFKEGGVADLSREAQVHELVEKNSRWLVNPAFSNTLFSLILEESKRLQEEPLVLVGFQGEHGALSEMAVGKYEKKWIPIPCKNFADIFEGVRTGGIDYGMVPVETSIEGGISQVTELLLESDVSIVGEIRMPVHHCLLALPETDHRDIKIAYSHPQALAHCRGFLRRNKIEGRPYHDAAGAALMLVQERPTASAVIGSPLCGEVYGLTPLMEGIEDNKSNFMRFVIIAKEPSKEEGNKGSVVFSLSHKAGALLEALKVFSDAALNLTRIESHTLKSKAGNAAFILDFEGSDKDQKVMDALKKIEAMSTMYKYLGCYRSIEER